MEINTKLLNRNDFKEKVFARDNYKCVVCKETAIDAHHIIERKLWDDGSDGYILSNGVSLCEECHVLAEMTLISCEELRKLADIQIPIFPSCLYEYHGLLREYDKWGNGLLPDGTRQPGPLFKSEQVQKILKQANLLHLFVEQKYYKYKRTPHLPWSEKSTDDDKRLVDIDHFIGREVVVTIKMDGENTSIYEDKTHARSINSDNHPSRDWIKGLWSRIGYQIPKDWRICGENLYALHTIPYSNLTSYFNVFSLWEKEWCFSWDETTIWCDLLELETVPVIYRGVFDQEAIINSFPKEYNGNKTEGYVIRIADGFDYDFFDYSVAKFVVDSFIINSDKHWMQNKVIPNKLKE